MIFVKNGDYVYGISEETVPVAFREAVHGGLTRQELERFADVCFSVRSYNVHRIRFVCGTKEYCRTLANLYTWLSNNFEVIDE